MSLRGHTVTVPVVGRHTHIEDVTTLQAVQCAAGVGGVTGEHHALLSHSLDGV